jgi:DNA-binding CsgD family transcriptional regulator
VVAAAATPSVRDLFAGLVPAEVIDAYERLLARDGCAKDQATELVGDSGLVDAMTDWGMAHVQPNSSAQPAWLQPASPDLALRAVLAGCQNRLVSRQELLLAGHQRLAEAQARFGVRGDDSFPPHLVSLISDRAEISGLSASLMNTAYQDWMTLENLCTEMPLTEDFASPPLPAFGGRVRCRSIYEAAAMEDPVARQIIATCVEAGEEARLLQQIPMKMKLADQATAMLPLAPAGTTGALLIKAPVVVAALREYFELLWERATPVNAHRTLPEEDRLTSAQQQVLDLMAEGLLDAGIANRLGVSLSTVRRHITVIMSRLNVTSRFAAGAAAQRRGWIA